MLKILLLGSGGRESALAWKMAQSPLCEKLYIAPGNPGTAAHGTNVALDINHPEAIGQFVLEQGIQLVVVGPEEPLVLGIRDHFEGHPALQDVAFIGPGRSGARLEGSKDFSKAFMMRHGIPTARYQSFRAGQEAEADAFLSQLAPPYVLKADGLAAGKGVLILHGLPEAQAELRQMLSGKFGQAGKTVVIEEFLSGIEFSVFALTDGKNYVLLPEAKDYKRIGEGDTGLNTGGMGAVSPVPFVTPDVMKTVQRTIVEPTIRGLAEEGIPYTGFIFFGLIQVGNTPMVIEYNARLGDPETEVVVPRIASDLVELFLLADRGQLEHAQLATNPQTATTVMVVSEGYPGEYVKGKAISGLENATECLVFHAGTAMNQEQLVTAGGRVMAFTGMGNGIQEALDQSYGGIRKVCYEGITFRKDIGRDLMH
jgi:phosphoribosylamine--glycine ligase